MRVLWQTGAVSDLMVDRPPKSAWNAPQPEMLALIAELFTAGRSDDEIAIEVELNGKKKTTVRRFTVRKK